MFWVLGFRYWVYVEVLGLSLGFGFRVRFQILGFRFRVRFQVLVQVLGFRFRFQVWRCFGFQVQVLGFGFRFRFQVSVRFQVLRFRFRFQVFRFQFRFQVQALGSGFRFLRIIETHFIYFDQCKSRSHNQLKRPHVALRAASDKLQHHEQFREAVYNPTPDNKQFWLRCNPPKRKDSSHLELGRKEQ